MNTDEGISAFAYRTAKEIENLIKERTNDLVEQNKIMEAQILSFRKTMISFRAIEVYDAHFGITSERPGEL